MYNHFLPYIPDNPHNRKNMELIRQAAEKYCQEKIEELPFSKYRIYFETGSRVEYEACYIEHRRRLNVFTAMALSSSDEVWISELEDIIWAVCNEFTWAFPAHIGDPADLEKCRITVDLFASETGLALSEICHLLSHRLSPIVLKRAEEEVRRRLLTPYKEENLTFYKDNWSAVCAGCIGMASMYWGGYEEFKQIQEKVMGSMADFIGSYQDDGCCLEGALYWAYGFGYFCYFAEMLRELSGGKTDLFREEKVKKIALFRQEIYLEKNVVIPFADAPHNYNYHIGLLHFLADEYPEAEVPNERYAAVFDEDIRHRFADFIRDFYWYDPNKKEKRKGQGTVLFAKSQWYLKKTARYSFSAKGGRNNEPHNHNDIGCFILYSEGRFIIDDLGWPEYDGDYFGEKRYDNFCASSEGHSVPIIGGAAQERGGHRCSRLLEAKEGNLSFELAGAYPDGACRRVIRRFCLEEGQIRMEDRVDGGNGILTERFITRIRPEVTEYGVRIGNWLLECEDKSAELRIGSKQFSPRLTICKMDMKPVETAYMIDFMIELEDETEAVFTLKEESPF